jgi:SNF2 family DNA or RNA helicase
VWVAHGDTDASTFAAIHTEYMAHPGPCVLIGTYQAWGESLNLQDTDHMVVAMVPITPGEIEQMEGRGARLGQSRPLTITYVLAENTIDERLAAILLDKLPAVERVTGETAGVAGLADTLRGTDDLDGLLCEILSTMDEWGADDADAD